MHFSYLIPPKPKGETKKRFTLDIQNLMFLSYFRHISLSLEMLLKLVAVFGPLVRSTVSAPPVVGVDLHGEERCYC